MEEEFARWNIRIMTFDRFAGRYSTHNQFPAQHSDQRAGEFPRGCGMIDVAIVIAPLAQGANLLQRKHHDFA